MFYKNYNIIKENTKVFFNNLKLKFNDNKLKILSPFVALNLLAATIQYTGVISNSKELSTYQYYNNNDNIKELYTQNRWNDNNKSLYSLAHKELLQNKELYINEKNKLLEYLKLINNYSNVEKFEQDIILLKKQNIITIDTEIRNILKLDNEIFYPLFQDGNFQKSNDLNYVTTENIRNYNSYLKFLIYNDITTSFLSDKTLEIIAELSDFQSFLDSKNKYSNEESNKLNKLKNKTLEYFTKDINEFKINLENDIEKELNNDLKDFYLKTLNNVTTIEQTFKSLFEKDIEINDLSRRN